MGQRYTETPVGDLMIDYDDTDIDERAIILSCGCLKDLKRFLQSRIDDIQHGIEDFGDLAGVAKEILGETEAE